MSELEPGREPEHIDEPEVLRPGEKPRPHAPPPEFQFKTPLFMRAVASVLLAGAGLIALVAGALFTLSIVGASIGIPLLILGFFLLVAALVVLVGGGKINVKKF